MEKWGLSAKWLINWEGSESVQGKIVSFLCSRFFLDWKWYSKYVLVLRCLQLWIKSTIPVVTSLFLGQTYHHIVFFFFSLVEIKQNFTQHSKMKN
jgi:hypothetical protein